MRGARAAFVIVSIALASCASPPLAWHTLVKPASIVGGDSASTAATGARGGNHVFEFAVPGVPAQVDRAELVVTDASRGLRVLEAERWLAPLPEEVRTALARAYAAASGAREVAGLPRPPGTPHVRVRTMLRRFELGGGQAAVDAEWSLQLVGDSARDALLCRWSGAGAAPAGTPGREVDAMQDVLAALGASIAGAGVAWVADPATPCPSATAVVDPRR